jgi:peptidoglycan/xylan/chitin deacetylase (PgdA/CDA1 family)
LKRGVERLSIGLGVARRGRRARRDTVAIVAYHNVVRNGSPTPADTSLHLPLDAFVAQIERLASTHDIVDLRAEPRANAAARPRAAITFDDAYAGAIRHALPALAERRLPAMVFVCPGLLDEPGFWWDRLSGHGGLAEAVRQRALHELGGRNRLVLDRMGPVHEVDADLRPASQEELHRAVYPGLALASHTWSHASLPALDDAELRDELERPQIWAEAHLDADVWAADHLSFPYGHWDERVARAATAAGYARLYRVEGGLAPAVDWQRPAAVLPRINVPSGLSADGLELRTAGVLG